MKVYILLIAVMLLITTVSAFSPKTYLPDRCSFGPKILCKEFSINCSDSDSLTMSLTNNIGDISFSVSESDISVQDGPVCENIRIDGGFALEYWNEGQEISLSVDCPGFREEYNQWSRSRFNIYLVLNNTKVPGVVFGTIQNSEGLKKTQRMQKIRNIQFATFCVVLSLIITSTFYYRPFRKHKGKILVVLWIVLLIGFVVWYLSKSPYV